MSLKSIWWYGRGVALICLALAVSHVPLFSAGEEWFDSQSFSFEGQLISCFAADINNEQGAELLIVYCADDGSRHLRCHRAPFGRKYDVIPFLDVPLPVSIFGVDITDLDQDGEKEILFLALDALYLLDPVAADSQFIKLAEFEKLFSIPDPGFVSELDFVFDLNGDGTHEFVLPCCDGARLLVRQGENYVSQHSFTLDYSTVALRSGRSIDGHPTLRGVFQIPRIAAYDLNTDLSPDLFIETDAGLVIFYQTGNLQFGQLPDKVIEVRPSFKEQLYFSSTGLDDLNGDGLVDYCRVFSYSDGFDSRTMLEVYLGNIHDGYGRRPSKRITFDELTVGLFLNDLNGNGSASLMALTTKIGITRMVKSLVVKKIPLELKIFQTRGGLIPDEPSAAKGFSCPVDLFGRLSPTRFVGCASADLDGDGMVELVAIDDDSRMQVYRGGVDPVFSDKPLATIETNGIRLIESVDLDRDNKDDLILFGRDEDGRNKITLLWSR